MTGDALFYFVAFTVFGTVCACGGMIGGALFTEWLASRPGRKS